jgi:hypothetical protein
MLDHHLSVRDDWIIYTERKLDTWIWDFLVFRVEHVKSYKPKTSPERDSSEFHRDRSFAF